MNQIQAQFQPNSCKTQDSFPHSPLGLGVSQIYPLSLRLDWSQQTNSSKQENRWAYKCQMVITLARELWDATQPL